QGGDDDRDHGGGDVGSQQPAGGQGGGGDGRPGGQAHAVVGGEGADQQQDEKGGDDTHGTVSASVRLAIGWWKPVCTRRTAGSPHWPYGPVWMPRSGAVNAAPGRYCPAPMRMDTLGE